MFKSNKDSTLPLVIVLPSLHIWLGITELKQRIKTIDEKLLTDWRASELHKEKSTYTGVTEPKKPKEFPITLQTVRIHHLENAA